MVTAKNKTIYQAGGTENLARNHQYCQNCGHHRHCKELLWGSTLGGDVMTTYKKHMSHFFLICYTCQCHRCKGVE